MAPKTSTPSTTETTADRRGITPPKAVYNPRTLEPPKRQGGAKGSPYIDKAQIPAIADMAKTQWVSPIEPVDTDVKGRLAMRHFKGAIAEHFGIPREAVAARLWALDPDTEPKPVQWVFALAIKKGALDGTSSE